MEIRLWCFIILICKFARVIADVVFINIYLSGIRNEIESASTDLKKVAIVESNHVVLEAKIFSAIEKQGTATLKTQVLF